MLIRTDALITANTVRICTIAIYTEVAGERFVSRYGGNPGKEHCLDNIPCDCFQKSEKWQVLTNYPTINNLSG